MQVKTYEEVFGGKLTIRDLVAGYKEDTKSGSVEAFGGKLNVRPPYQRAFIYEDNKKKAVINTVMHGYPLNVMYWAKTKDGYELMDGQQRTISLCKYFKGEYSVELDYAGKQTPMNFDSLKSEQRDAFLNYPLTIYICEGDEKEKLDWFRIINIAGVRLTQQEMRNAIYTSAWTTDAKKYFSRVDGEGYASEGHISNDHTYGDYLNVCGGTKSEDEKAVVRQHLLEIVLGWAVDAYNRQYGRKIDIDDYMSLHITDSDAKELWRYYEDVMEWVKKTFKHYHKEMIAVEWGRLYNMYHTTADADEADRRAEILWDHKDEITNVKGIYEAALTGDLKFIHARVFDAKDKHWAYNKQKGVCPYCHGTFTEDQMEGDHIVPWSKGGATDRTNLQMLCAECNGKKSAHDGKCSPFDTSEYEPFNLEEWDAVDTYDSNILNITDD